MLAERVDSGVAGTSGPDRLDREISPFHLCLAVSGQASCSCGLDHGHRFVA